MAAVTVQPPLQPAWLDRPDTIGDVLCNIDRVIEWAIGAESHIGYFAVLYRRVTLAIREAVEHGTFRHGDRIERLDVEFARRYFDAVNAFFHPDGRRDLTLPWEVAFVGDHDDQAIIVQHMMTGLNAHIRFDLGLALVAVAGDGLSLLKEDYHRVNVLLCAQIPGMLAEVERLSPGLRWTRWLLPDEVGLLQRALTELRSEAWHFAAYTVLNPRRARERAVHQEACTAALSSEYLQPSGKWTPLPRFVRAAAKHESDDVAANILALEDISRRPEKPDVTKGSAGPA
ncbi:DUF5995 family protein [Mycobacterium parmense]|uniref:Uncharacterized protein n=1 Tax=Mycobacterium parmense TaxID=185642 RepID=A0A7I7YW60_9MYCO|nr:DUF5995 family protein [Mycobacterium parmense]MCV7350441.1 hypothetical protein [Mycobacterium parmense]ORW48175.1 hypothetical protein AWC20_24770 [Mycobacterium parmense]BBZ46135.1 hypothetical protein MPRM_34160 [Mycobacterium parmense]